MFNLSRLKILSIFMKIVKGNKITPQADLFATISEPHGTQTTASGTFLRYEWATEWHNRCIYIFYPEIQDGGRKWKLYSEKLEKPQIARINTTASSIFWGLEIPLNYFPYCVMQAGVRIRRCMAAHKHEILIPQPVYNVAAPFKGYAHVFKVQCLYETIQHNATQIHVCYCGR